nr:MAG TPA: hypothetical protein [Crassvirales sp.]DAH00415.1 MAG TPA: hypothetical protein [Crassvirales sp.]
MCAFKRSANRVSKFEFTKNTTGFTTVRLPF